MLEPIEPVLDFNETHEIDIQIGDLFSSISQRTTSLKKSLAAKNVPEPVEHIDVDLSKDEVDSLNMSITTVVH